MNTYKIIRTFFGLGILFSLLTLTFQSSRAEVGATIPDAGSEPTIADLNILQYIVDDADPITGTAWLRHNADTPTRFVLNDAGYLNNDGRPTILTAGSPRRQLVAWSRNSAQGYDVVLSRFEAGGWTTPEVLAGDPSLDELDPALVLDSATGNVHLFYWENGATPRVMHRWTDPSLASWSTPEQVSAPGEIACRPGGVFHNGILRVAYELHDYGFSQTPRQVVVARQDGSSWTPEVVAISQQPGELRPELHSHNGVLWIDWIDSDLDAAWTRMDGQGVWEPIQYEPYANLEEREFHVRGAIRSKAIR